MRPEPTTEPTTLYITRHGETQWNTEGRMQGSLDSPLTDSGRRQAQGLAVRLADVPLDAIYASPTPRAWATADILRGHRDLPLHSEARLREICMGVWEGQLGGAIDATHPEQHHAFWKAPHLYVPVEGAEPFEDVRVRAAQAIADIVARHPGGTVLLVTHTVCLRLIMAGFEGIPLSGLWTAGPLIRPTSLCKVLVDPSTNGAVVELHGDTSHFGA